MKKVSYSMRVFIVSFEFLVLIIGAVVYLTQADVIISYQDKITLNEGAIQYSVYYPFLLTIWMFSKGRVILFPSEKVNSILHGWEDYWKLRVHFFIGLLYAVGMCFVTLVLWVTNSFSTPAGVFALIVLLLIVSIAALSFYLAIIKVKELLVHVE